MIIRIKRAQKNCRKATSQKTVFTKAKLSHSHFITYTQSVLSLFLIFHNNTTKIVFCITILQIIWHILWSLLHHWSATSWTPILSSLTPCKNALSRDILSKKSTVINCICSTRRTPWSQYNKLSSFINYSGLYFRRLSWNRQLSYVTQIQLHCLYP